jgi:site-specific DNA recombinase
VKGGYLPTQTPDILTRSPIEILSELTAVIYLRVSSPSQLTGRNPDGYSIEGQREACKRHAERLGARIVGEYVEPGKTATNARRPALQRMLQELPDLQVDYVIFFDISRAVRDEFDAFWLKREIESGGARLESTLEPISDDDTGMLVYTILAGVNAHRSRMDGRKVKVGLERKFADGGSHGPARIGYLNTTEIVGHREVATIEVDKARAPLVKRTFDLAATGEHTITTITEIMEEDGLRTRGSLKRPSRPLSRSMIHRMLRDDYYIGIVTRGVVKRQGRHEAIIDRETFEQVQHVLDGHRASGDRSHKHTHYLTRSLFCGVCGKRLGYGRHRSRSGDYYEYYSCLSRVSKHGRCEAPYFRLHEIEGEVEEQYKTLLLTPAEQTAIREALAAHVESHAEIARTEADRHQRRLHELTGQQQKLLQLYYNGGVSEEVMQAEQERIETERVSAERWSDAAKRQVEDVDQALADALVLIDLGTAPYLTASPLEQRLINLAIYRALFVYHPTTIKGKPTDFYARLVALARQLAQEAPQDAPKQPTVPQNVRKRPQNERGPVFRGRGSQSVQMAERAGFEPAMEFNPHTRLAGECLQPLGHLSWTSEEAV